MPYKFDYMEEYRALEKELAMLLSFVAELESRDYDHKKAAQVDGSPAHNAGWGQEVVDAYTALVCAHCRRLSSRTMRMGRSLELQIWWRDYQESERKNIARSGVPAFG